MNEDFAESPSSPSASSATSENSSNVTDCAAAQPQSEVVSPVSANQSIFDQANQPHSPVTALGKNSSSINIEPAGPADKTAEYAILPEPSSNTSCHTRTDVMNDDDNDLDNYDITKLRAAVPLMNVKQPNKTKKQLITRLENFLFDHFDSLAKVIIVKHRDTCLA